MNQLTNAADPDALGRLGASLLAAERYEPAAATLRQALQRAPLDAGLHYNLAQALMRLNDGAGALKHLYAAVGANPGFALAQAALGSLLESLGKLPAALAAFDAAIAIQPAQPKVHYNRGVVLLRLGRANDAASAFNHALRLGHATAATHNNLGLSLRRCADLSAAIAHFQQALQMDENCTQAWVNLGNAVMDCGDVSGAIKHYQRALEIDRADASARLNLGFAALLGGDFARGWPLFETRWDPSKPETIPNAPLGVPVWDPDVIAPAERTLVLVAEQGLGDVIQFVRFASELRGHGHRPVLQCPRQLVRLLGSASGVSAVIAHGMPLPTDDCVWYPLMSVPARLGIDLGDLPANTPYLSPEPERVAYWASRLGSRRYRIGIAWQGAPEHEHEALRGRSVPLEHFEPLLALAGIEWISLQKGPGLEQLAAVPWRARVHEFAELDAGPDAFVDTAALMSHLDLVITSDTAIAHLAGALGRPVWLALAFMPDWRWQLERTDSPWYPTMRMYRQRRTGDWIQVFADMRRELHARLQQGGISPVV